jgi:hypothetical protein
MLGGNVMLKSLVAATAVTSLFTACSAFGAVVLVNDPFTDGGRTNGTDAQDIAWWQTGANGTYQVQTDPVTSSNALLRQPTNGFTRYVGFFNGTTGPNTAQSLAVGDSLSLKFDFRYVSLPTNAANGLRFGLFNSQGTRQADEFAGNAGNNFNGRLGDAGYYVGLNFGSNAAGSGVIFRETDADGGPTGGGEVVGLGGGFNSVVIDTAVHSLTLTIKRISATSTDVTYQYDNTTAVTRNDSTQNTAAFDAIYIGQGSDFSPFYVDNVNVTYTAVPEPTSVAVLGLAGLFLTSRRRQA